MKISFNFDNIILIGFMGSGKTAVGQSLAKKLGWNFVDTDQIIESTAGKSISEIFETQGESQFRVLESRTIGTLKGSCHQVISTGGGIVLKKDNITNLKQLGRLVYLMVDGKTAARRLSGVTNRPLLKAANPIDKIEEILAGRLPVYLAAADLVVDTADLDVNQVVDKILEGLAQ